MAYYVDPNAFSSQYNPYTRDGVSGIFKLYDNICIGDIIALTWNENYGESEHNIARVYMRIVSITRPARQLLNFPSAGSLGRALLRNIERGKIVVKFLDGTQSNLFTDFYSITDTVIKQLAATGFGDRVYNDHLYSQGSLYVYHTSSVELKKAMEGEISARRSYAYRQEESKRLQEEHRRQEEARQRQKEIDDRAAAADINKLFGN